MLICVYPDTLRLLLYLGHRDLWLYQGHRRLWLYPGPEVRHRWYFGLALWLYFGLALRYFVLRACRFLVYFVPGAWSYEEIDNVLLELGCVEGLVLPDEEKNWTVTSVGTVPIPASLVLPLDIASLQAFYEPPCSYSFSLKTGTPCLDWLLPLHSHR